MGLFSRNKKQEPNKISHLAVDIGTENVKTVVFRVEDDEIVVVGYSRVPQTEFAMNKAIIMDVEEVTENVIKSIQEALDHATSLFTDVTMPQDMVLGIAGELVTGVPIVVNVDRDKPDTKVTEKELGTIIGKVKEFSFESTIEEIAENIGLSAAQLVEIDTVVDSISIDGAKTKNPIGYSGKEISYRVFSSFAPKAQLETLEQVASNIEIQVRSIQVEPYALAFALEDIKKDRNGGIIIDIGAGTTDVVVARDGEVLGLKMFSIGGRVFTKRIEKEMGVSYEEAENLKHKYSMKTLDSYQINEIRDMIKQDTESWLLGVQLALEELKEVEEFPVNIYLCGGGSLLPEIMDGMLSFPWSQFLNFKKHPKAQLLLPNKINRIKDATRSITEPMDITPLALTKVYL